MKPLKVGDECQWEEVRNDEGCGTVGMSGGEGKTVGHQMVGPIQ